MVRRTLLLLLVPLVLSGCVTRTKYDALEALRGKTAASLAEREREKAELQASLDAEQQRAKALDAKIAELTGQLTAAQEALAAANRDKTALAAEKAAIVSDRSRLAASVEEMRAALAELQRRKAEADARIAEFRGLLARFKALIDSGKLRVKIVDGRMVVELASDVLFASGSATLSKDGLASVAEVAGVLATIAGRKFQVEGHTDNVPIRSAAYPSNWELAAARALTVVKRMVEAGMPPDRISASSYGEYKPAKENETPEGRAANRRIEIVVVPDLSSLPGFDELNRAAGQ